MRQTWLHRSPNRLALLTVSIILCVCVVPGLVSDGMNLGQPIVPLFISIDPKRDTPARLREYKTKFSPRVQWLTGTDDEVRAMTKAFRIYYSSSETAEGADEDYLLDHSIFFYLMDRDGKFGEVFGSNVTPDEIAMKTAKFIQAENK
jgi:cytochrome oxidase Cu insertion factor (SCO1/SenC/PrrC family)